MKVTGMCLPENENRGIRCWISRGSLGVGSPKMNMVTPKKLVIYTIMLVSDKLADHLACPFRVAALSGNIALALSLNGLFPKLNKIQWHFNLQNRRSYA